MVTVVTMSTPLDRLITDPVLSAPALPPFRQLGSLDAITDSERRALRSIGAGAREIAARTGELLSQLLRPPNVRIFAGVRSAATTGPRIPHAINAGSRVLLVESVAWPAGHYTVEQNGRIHCDSVYIGQSAWPLITAVQRWREMLNPGHVVSALVVVHKATDGDLCLPADFASDLSWVSADDAVRAVEARLPAERQPDSWRAVAALVAATDTEENR
jgi:hypothetical protein